MVIGTVSTEGKAEAARAAGADHVISYDNFADKVRDLTEGRAWPPSMTGLARPRSRAAWRRFAPEGPWRLYGTASGPTPPLEIPRLNSGGSLYVTRPSVVHYTVTTEELRRRTNDVFGWVANGDSHGQHRRALPDHASQ
jgi:NADPH2:quinone reductase